MITATNEIDIVVSAMQRGAYDYLVKPVDKNKLLTTIRNAIKHREMQLRLLKLERALNRESFGNLVGESPAMRQLYGELEQVAASDVTVLIHGESGTGKELIARAIHDNSGRNAGPFVAINCAAIPQDLIESELFGHERGAFTGANTRRTGRFEQANGGTLFLDEIGELKLDVQAKLLRVLQERRFHRVGATDEVTVDFRLLAATHRDLRQRMMTGEFREDLYFRIAVFEVFVPPLRDRIGDIPPLAFWFARTITTAGKTPQSIHPDAVACLEGYHWPGNVRELRNAIERALVVCRNSEIKVTDLPRWLTTHTTHTPPKISSSLSSLPAPFTPTPIVAESTQPTQPIQLPFTPQPITLILEELERWAVSTAMQQTQGNISHAAKQLGISRSTLYRKLKQYNIEIPPPNDQ